MRITYDKEENKVRIHDIPCYSIENTDLTMQDVLDFLYGRMSWHATWTTDISVEDMLDTKVRDMAVLGEFTVTHQKS